jgi:hypothetical protein
MSVVGSVTLNAAQGVAPSTLKQGIFNSTFKETLSNIDRNYLNIERQLNLAAKSDRLSPSQLLALQSGVFRSSLELDITSKVIEKVSSGVKQTMNNQV